MSTWIKSTDKVPLEDVYVLGCGIDGYEVCTCKIIDNAQDWRDQHLYSCKIDCWMYLPVPLKKLKFWEAMRALEEGRKIKCLSWNETIPPEKEEELKLGVCKVSINWKELIKTEWELTE